MRDQKIEDVVRSTPQTSKLLLLGVNHTTAPIEVRERLAIPAARLADATRTLVHQPGIREGLILSTCNRVEFVTLQDSADDPSEIAVPSGSPDLLRFLHEYFALPAAELAPHLYEFREREAVRHLFRVASSLDSMVVGEPQILGQVKESYTVAREVGAVANTLDPLFQRAFSVAKRVRATPRARSMLAMFAQAMSSTSATIVMRILSGSENSLRNGETPRLPGVSSTLECAMSLRCFCEGFGPR